MRTVVAAALVLLLAAAGCSSSGPPNDRSPAAPSSGPSSSRPRCGHVSYAEVKGPRPSYGRRTLRRYPAERAVCDAYWLSQTAQDFVPQSLAVDGSTAYVGGYRWARSMGDRPCQIAVVDLATGRELAFQERFQASVYRPAPTFCRHGGGMDLARDGLWVQETQRLWLLDPAAVGHGDPVRRVWRMGAGLRGSAMLVRGDRVGVASFSTRNPGRILWFRTAALLRAGVDDLVLSGGDDTDARPVATGRVPPLLQGITSRSGALWYSTSGNGCAQLRGPDGDVGSVPGAEDVQFSGRALYVVSESGARPYVDDLAMVPALLRLDSRALLAASPRCR